MAKLADSIVDLLMEATVTIKQAGGKYGTFQCPECESLATFDFSSGSGWCDSCNSQFIHGYNDSDGEMQPYHRDSDNIINLEIIHGKSQ